MRRLLFVLIAIAACDGADPTPPGIRGHWFTTCGDPTCLGGHRDAGLPTCAPPELAGAPCSTASAQCDFGDACNIHLLCATSDPKLAGCPISRMRFKKDIRYLSDVERSSYRDQLLSLPLATYRYRGAEASSRLHLGFMIDGHESLACVDGDTVDLYSYASMAVAALQSQEKEIALLRNELRQLRKEIRRR